MEMHLLQILVHIKMPIIQARVKKELNSQRSAMDKNTKIQVHREQALTAVINPNSGLQEADIQQEDWNLTHIRIKHCKTSAEIELIIQCIFKYLSLQDLKNARIVNHSWYLIAESVVRKRAKIIFHPSKLSPSTFIQSTSLLLSVQDVCAFPIAPYSSFAFYGHTEWDFQEILNFFQNFGKNVTQLEFDALKSPSREEIIQYLEKLCTTDLRVWMDPSIVTKLHLINNNIFSLKFSLGKFTSIQDLSISGYSINIDEMETRIVPISLNLEKVEFCINDVKIESEECLLNNIIDFSKAMKIWIRDKSLTGYLDLDMVGENVNAQIIVLSFVEAGKLEECTWAVEKLSLCGMEFIERTKMKIRELYFDYCNIDLSALPDSLEKLEIKYFIGLDLEEDIICTRPILLGNLKHLRCLFKAERNFSFLSEFNNCINLVYLELCGGRSCNCNVENIPQSVTTVKLKGIDITGNETLHVNKLILDGYTVYHAECTVARIKSHELVLVLNNHHPREFYRTTNFKIIRFVLANNSTFEKILIGKCYRRLWDKEEYSENIIQIAIEGGGLTFAEYVDEIADYYSFSHFHGVAISEKYFQDSCIL